MGKRKRRKKAGPRWRRWVLLALGIPVVVSVALTLPIRWLNPATTSFIMHDDSGRIPVFQEWRDWEQLGSAAALAVVASEDQRFADHIGLDFRAIRRSLANAEDGGDLRGASTISQQLAKNLYLWPGRSFLRKGLEAWLTLNLELFLPKRRILEVYLNVAEFGPGIYGVPAASSYFFGKAPTNLSDREAALLAAVLPNPARLQADRPSRYVRERQSWILGQMQRLRREGWLDALE
jgi:monofunctional biosynthetic peptidoglycan transglycosylase